VKRIIVIPARFASTRLPGKPLLEIGGTTLLMRVYEQALKSELKEAVVIATDDERIRSHACSFGADVVMTESALPSGTDRVYQAIRDRDAGSVVNLQGDEPFIRADMIDLLFRALEEGEAPMVTLGAPLRSRVEYDDPNTVKVVLDRGGCALYFSRSAIPFVRGEEPPVLYRHIGLYGYSMDFLTRFVSLPRGPLEKAESLEQLRALENGYRIRVLYTDYEGFGIDTEDDLARARNVINGIDIDPKR
jgi:3-deoxy-manno-octulosonate cytidylyltransferase (CMP-KDO synthetase)